MLLVCDVGIGPSLTGHRHAHVVYTYNTARDGSSQVNPTQLQATKHIVASIKHTYMVTTVCSQGWSSRARGQAPCLVSEEQGGTSDRRFRLSTSWPIKWRRTIKGLTWRERKEADCERSGVQGCRLTTNLQKVGLRRTAELSSAPRK